VVAIKYCERDDSRGDQAESNGETAHSALFQCVLILSDRWFGHAPSRTARPQQYDAA
jgi:hypothetical protein